MTRQDMGSTFLFNCAKRIWVVVATLLLTLCFSPDDAHARNVIKQPGAHNRYGFELEPQLVVRYHSAYGWNNAYWNGYGYNTGIGPGVRVSIPFMHNGPIKELNNNIGITFGGSTTFHGCPGCTTATVINIPVAFQWNFYLTEVISVLGEAGINTPLTIWGGGRNANFTVEPLFQGGGRFQWDSIGVLVRIGWPMISVGANFQF